ncbi:hypothetical protein [Aurantiacibacter odishensis]|uniref:hypothetical protein n=1 Tax=Aurantiacibacter odishensis TaxID=1155476 RepID=UPI000E71C608|nr:hypothetical protein [Aurantiacibacter odishensis]
MQVHPDIAALRSDRAPQREAQEAMLAAGEAWAREPGAADLQSALRAFGAGAPLEACPMLEAMFTGSGEAERLMDLMSRHYCRAMAAHPIGHPPFRQGFDGTSTSILLASSGRAQLMLQAKEPGTMIHPGYMFCDAVRFDAVLGGAADARIVRMARRDGTTAGFSQESLVLRAGHRLALDLASETLVVDEVQSRFVVLRLLRTAADPQPGREYDAASGNLMHQSAGRIGTSRREATIALLGRMGRTDAVPAMARVALEEGDVSMRWQALREALALDTATGFCALNTVARRKDDPLAREAGALRARLLETYPMLAELEAEQCPA